MSAEGTGLKVAANAHWRRRLRAWWVLSRPKMLPSLWGLVAAGFGFAHWDRALSLRGAQGLGWVLLAWAALHAGTLLINAAVDQDEGEVLFGEAVPVPPNTNVVGYLLLFCTVALAWLAAPLATFAAVCCVVLAVLYSHPLTLFKAHPLGGPLVNWVGYGLLTPLAGWSVVGVSPNPRTVAVWLLGSFSLLGFYFAAQAFQQREDADRGYRTLVVTAGPRGVLLASRWCLGIAFSAGVVLAIIGWLPRVCLLGAPLFAWADRWLVQWLERPGGGEASDALELIRRVGVASACWLLLAFGAYIHSSLSGVPVAGLGTAAGHPTDRPMLPPAAMLIWDQIHETQPQQ